MGAASGGAPRRDLAWRSGGGCPLRLAACRRPATSPTRCAHEGRKAPVTALSPQPRQRRLWRLELALCHVAVGRASGDGLALHVVALPAGFHRFFLFRLEALVEVAAAFRPDLVFLVELLIRSQQAQRG